MTHPRAADDFAAIRARLEELRQQRDQVSAEPEWPISPQPSPARGEPKAAAPRSLPPASPRTFRN